MVWGYENRPINKLASLGMSSKLEEEENISKNWLNINESIINKLIAECNTINKNWLSNKERSKIERKIKNKIKKRINQKKRKQCIKISEFELILEKASTQSIKDHQNQLSENRKKSYDQILSILNSNRNNKFNELFLTFIYNFRDILAHKDNVPSDVILFIKSIDILAKKDSNVELSIRLSEIYSYMNIIRESNKIMG